MFNRRPAANGLKEGSADHLFKIAVKANPNFLVTAIILWNTRYLERAVRALRQTEGVPDHLLIHLSPLGWEHINLTGDYVGVDVEQMTENPDGFRPLQQPFEAIRLAA
jgi:hypothetical protein